MRAYIATTGFLFGLLALAHLSRIVGEWPRLLHDPGEILEAAIGIAAAGLCYWAWRLFRVTARS